MNVYIKPLWLSYCSSKYNYILVLKTTPKTSFEIHLCFRNNTYINALLELYYYYGLDGWHSFLTVWSILYFQERHWTSPGMATVLQAAINSPQSDRLKQILKMAPRILDVYFAIILRDVNNCMSLWFWMFFWHWYIIFLLTETSWFAEIIYWCIISFSL